MNAVNVVSEMMEVVCIITDPMTDEILVSAEVTLQIANCTEVSGTGTFYAAPGATLADGSTAAPLTITAGRINEGNTLDLGAFQANNSDAVLQMALAGIGIMVLPKWMSHRYIQNGVLEALLTEYTLQGFPNQAVYPHNRYVPSKVRSFVSFLQQAFAGDPLLQS